MAAHVLGRRPYQGPNYGKGWTASRIAALRWGVSVGVVGGLLSGIWAVPFVWRSNLMNDMGWEKIGTGVDSGLTLYNEPVSTYFDALFPNELLPILLFGLRQCSAWPCSCAARSASSGS